MAPIQLCGRAEGMPSAIASSFSENVFTLDSSGIAGFLGGQEAINAMTTVNLFHGRRWCGLYNTPGSYEIAKRYGMLARSRVWNGLFPGDDQSPAELIGLGGKQGPRYVAAQSGTVLANTGHMVHLLMRAAKDVDVETVATSRTSAESFVTVVELHHAPPSSVYPRLLQTRAPLLAVFPIAASAGAFIACALATDWWCLGCIALGMLANGVACFVIGSGRLVFTHAVATKGAPAGDGLLAGDDATGLVLVKGAEGAVTPITRGAFALEYPGREPAQYTAIGWCAALLATQFVLQLLLIPQGTLFGQTMFVLSLACSWVYNNCLSSLDRTHVQKEILLDVIRLKPKKHVRRFKLGTRTATAVFACLVLRPKDTRAFLQELLPNDTEVWNRWKNAVSERIVGRSALTFADAGWDAEGLKDEEKELLKSLYLDAQEAYDGYQKHLSGRGPAST